MGAGREPSSHPGVTWGRFMVIGGFVGAIVIGAAVAIVNTGFRLGS